MSKIRLSTNLFRQKIERSHWACENLFVPDSERIQSSVTAKKHTKDASSMLERNDCLGICEVAITAGRDGRNN